MTTPLHAESLLNIDECRSLPLCFARHGPRRTYYMRPNALRTLDTNTVHDVLRHTFAAGVASSRTRSLQPIVLEGVVLQYRYTPHVPHLPYLFRTGSRSTAMTGIGACTPRSSTRSTLSSTTAEPNRTLSHQPPSQHFRARRTQKRTYTCACTTRSPRNTGFPTSTSAASPPSTLTSHRIPDRGNERTHEICVTSQFGHPSLTLVLRSSLPERHLRSRHLCSSR